MKILLGELECNNLQNTDGENDSPVDVVPNVLQSPVIERNNRDEYSYAYLEDQENAPAILKERLKREEERSQDHLYHEDQGVHLSHLGFNTL